MSALPTYTIGAKSVTEFENIESILLEFFSSISNMIDSVVTVDSSNLMISCDLNKSQNFPLQSLKDLKLRLVTIESEKKTINLHFELPKNRVNIAYSIITIKNYSPEKISLFYIDSNLDLIAK